MRHLFLAFFFLLNCVLVTGQEIWPIEKCIEYALENSLDLEVQDKTNELSDLLIKQSKSNFGPNLNAQFDVSEQFGRSIDPTTNTFRNVNTFANTYFLSNNIEIFNGMQKWNSLKRSKLQAEAGQLTRQMIEENIQLNILTTYLSVIKGKEQLQQATTQKNISEEQLERTQSMVEAGVLAENEIITLEAQVANDYSRMTAAENLITLGLTNLKILLRLDPDTEIDVDIPDLDDLGSMERGLSPLQEIYSYAVVNRPEVQNSEMGEILADYDSKIAKGGQYPTISFGASIVTNYSNQFRDFDVMVGFEEQVIGTLESDPSENVIGQIPFTTTTFTNIDYFKQLNNNLSYSLGVSMNIPIFNKNLTRLNIQQSSILAEQSRLTTEQTKYTLYNTIQQAYTNAVAAMDSYRAAEASLEAAQKSLDSERSKLNAGAGTNLEFNVASNNWSIASSLLIGAKYDYIFYTKYLDFFQGKPISF